MRGFEIIKIVSENDEEEGQSGRRRETDREREIIRESEEEDEEIDKGRRRS